MIIWLIVIFIFVVIAVLLWPKNSNHTVLGGGDPQIIPFVLSDYLRIANDENRINLPQDAIDNWNTNYSEYSHLFAAAVKVLRDGKPPAIKSPPITKISKGIILYNIQPTEICGLRTNDWFLIQESDIPIMTEFQKNMNPKFLQLCKYEVIEDISLIQLGANYTYIDLERWITSIDNKYQPIFNDLGAGDNKVPADWLTNNNNIQGWYESPGSLPVPLMMTEIMIINGDKYLNLISSDKIDI